MVVLSSQPTLDLNRYSVLRTCKPPTTSSSADIRIPQIDLSDPDAKSQIVKACEEFGFFKLVNHTVPMDLINKLEEEALCFFNLPQSEKDKSRPPDPFGYGSKTIGSSGDKGWIEYLLLNANPVPISPQNSQTFLSAAKEYVMAVKKVSCEVVELIAEGLKIEPRNVISRVLKDEKSDCCFRVNHYPAIEEVEESGVKVVGFGEHTDPQIISVLRSNKSSGLQICLKDGAWVSVAPDERALFVNVGDALQVMTNGRFRSVKHKVVVADTRKQRISMIFFGGPPLSHKISPLPQLLPDPQQSLYKEFTWWEYKTAAYKTRLADYRLGFFEK